MMNAFRLQTFAPGRGAAAAPGHDERRLRVAREEGYNAGYLAGQGAATESFVEDQSRLTSELVEAIGDARLTNEAARRHVAASLAPMVEALAAAIAPALAEAGVGAEIARLVARALEAVPGARPRLRCAPELAPRLAELLAERGLDAEIEPAADLLPREAQLSWDQGYDHLDLDACVAQVRACIASSLRPQSKDGDSDDDPRRFG
jgi:flagellar biosynthesis/type III secretory pathway protein FliH